MEAARPSGHLPHRPCAGPSDLAASCLTRCRPRGRLRQFGGRHVGGARGGGHRPPAPSCGRWWRPTRHMFGQWRWRLPDASLLGHLSKPKLPRRGAVAGARGPLRTSLRGESVFLHRRPTQWSPVAQGGDAETACDTPGSPRPRSSCGHVTWCPRRGGPSWAVARGATRCGPPRCAGSRTLALWSGAPSAAPTPRQGAPVACCNSALGPLPPSVLWSACGVGLALTR